MCARPRTSPYSSTTRSPRDPYGHAKPNQLTRDAGPQWTPWDSDTAYHSSRWVWTFPPPQHRNGTLRSPDSESRFPFSFIPFPVVKFGTRGFRWVIESCYRINSRLSDRFCFLLKFSSYGWMELRAAWFQFGGLGRNSNFFFLFISRRQQAHNPRGDRHL